MDAIALGCLTAIFLSARRVSRPALRALGSTGIAILIFSLCFSERAIRWGLARNGLDMTILAVGACMVIVAASGSRWRSPTILVPLIRLGQRSYEVYLSHMFVVFTFFNLFVAIGKPLGAVPILFIAVISVAAVLGEVTARSYSEPLNRLLRNRAGDGFRSAWDL